MPLISGFADAVKNAFLDAGLVSQRASEANASAAAAEDAAQRAEGATGNIQAGTAVGSLTDFANKFDTATQTSFYLAEKGREGLFMYDASDTTSVQDPALVLVKNDKRYRRVIADKINVKWWDVKGDGVTDDTANFMKAVTYWAANGGELYIPNGLYIVNMPTTYNNGVASPAIKVAVGIKKITVSGSNAVLKTKKGTPASAGVLRNDPSAFRLEANNDCDLHISGVKVFGSRDTEEDDYEQIPNNIYVPYSARTSNNSFGFQLKGFNVITMYNCDVKNLHGRAVFSDGAAMLRVIGGDIDDVSRVAVETSNNTQDLVVIGARIANIGIMKPEFNVDGVKYQFDNDPSGKVWYTDVGDGVYHLGPDMQIIGNHFLNINRISICTDIKNLATNSYLMATDNMIEHNHLRLRCSNPHASIWIEKAHSADIHGNKINYINRAVSEELAGYAIVCAVSTRLNCDFNIDKNTIYTQGYNKNNLVGIKTINNSGSVKVTRNDCFGKFFACAYHTNVNNADGVRHLEQLVYESNNFTNTFDNAGVCVFAYDSTATDGGGIPWIKKYYFKHNVIKAANKTRANCYPYASVLNEVMDNDFDGTSIDLRNYNYPDNCLYIEDNKNVKGLMPKNGIAGETNSLYIRRNYFLNSLELSTSVGTQRIKGDVSNNVVNGRAFVQSFRDLAFKDNLFIGDGIYINNITQSSARLDVLTNKFLLNSDKFALSINNSNQFTGQNVTVRTNIFDIMDGAVNTTAVRFSMAGPKLNLAIDDNTYNGITYKEVNTGIAIPIKATLPFNIPSVAAGATYTSPGSNVPGAKLGMFVQAAMDIDLGGLDPVRAFVSADDTVKFMVRNPTAAAIDPPLANVNFIVTAI